MYITKKNKNLSHLYIKILRIKGKPQCCSFLFYIYVLEIRCDTCINQLYFLEDQNFSGLTLNITLLANIILCLFWNPVARETLLGRKTVHTFPF